MLWIHGDLKQATNALSTLPNFEWTLLDRYRMFLWLSFQNLAACFRYTRVLSIYSSFEMHWIDTIYWIIVCWVKNCKKAPNLRESHHTIVDPSAIWTFYISFSKCHSLKLKKVIVICTNLILFLSEKATDKYGITKHFTFALTHLSKFWKMVISLQHGFSLPLRVY